MSKRYFFKEIENCEMCGSLSSKHKVMGMRMNQSQGLRPKKKSGIAVGVRKCTVCGLIYSSPMPIPFNIQDHYGIPPESYWKPSYFNWQESYFSSEIKTLKQLIEFVPEMKALDIGAGIGKCMMSLEKAGFDAYGLEPSQPFFDKAISEMKISPQKLKLGMMEELEYENDYFDFITFGAVLEHLYHPAANLEKALRWLKPGGIIHIEVPSSGHLIPKLINVYYRLVGTNYVTNISPMHEPFHLYEFGLESFKMNGQRLNYSVVHHKYSVCDIYFVPRILHPVLRSVMQVTNSGMQLTVWIKKSII